MRYKLRAMRPLLLLLCSVAAIELPQLLPVPARTRAFVGASIVDSSGRVAFIRGTLVVYDGRIMNVGTRVSVPPHVPTVDLSGRTLVPGLVNTHGHVGETVGLRSAVELYTPQNVAAQLELYAQYGITTVLSLGGDREAGFDARRSQDTAALARARLFVSGPVIAAATPDEARKAVDAVAPLRPDFVKIRVDDNLGTTQKMSEAVYTAVIEQAHRHNLRVAAHLFYLDDAKGLLRAGVDFIAHSVRDRDVDDELIRLLQARNVCVCPTLTREVSTFVYETRPAFFDDPFFLRAADKQVIEQLLDPKRQQAMRESGAAQRYKVALQVASRNLKKLADSNVRIAFGTDSGPPSRFQGYFEHMELELMAKAGLTPQQILMAATGDAARCIGMAGNIGTIAPGAWADFIVLKESPITDIRKMRTIEGVYIAGNRVP
jgi:imidazolonepropionase-like amidohydrolase